MLSGSELPEKDFAKIKIFYIFAALKVKQEIEPMKKRMMKVLWYINLFILVLAFGSCKEQKSVADGCIRFDLSESLSDTLNVQDRIYPLELIALETTEESLLGSVDKLIEAYGRYYVLDHMRKCVLVFDSTGKFLHSVGRVGQGPGEYSDLSDFIVDEKTGCLYLLTNTSTIYAYDDGGGFLWKRKISNSLLWNIGSCEDGYVCSTNHLTYTSGEDAFLLYRFDKGFQEKDRSVGVYEKQIYSPLFISDPFQKWNGGSFYMDTFSNIVYSLSGEKVLPFGQFVFSSPMPIEYFADSNLVLENQFRYDFVMESFFSEKFLWVSYIHNGEHHTTLFDVMGDKVVASGKTVGVMPKVYQSGESLLSPLSADLYLDCWTHLDKMLKQPVSIEDNHLILRWKIKE